MMKSKVEGHNYVILYDEERFPVKLNRKRLDKSLIELNISLQKIKLLMKQLYETDYDTYVFLRDVVFGDYAFRFEDGISYGLEDVIESLSSAQNYLLTHSDEIKGREEIETLEDLGYQYYGLGLRNIAYEKVLEDTDEKEVVEEILEVDGKVQRRIRETIWELTDYGKSGKKFSCKKIGNTKRIVKAYFNSKAEREKNMKV